MNKLTRVEFVGLGFLSELLLGLVVLLFLGVI